MKRLVKVITLFLTETTKKNISECSNSESEESDDDFKEIDDSECNTGNMDTMFDSQNQHVQHLEYTFTPGEDRQPILHESLAEYLSFPTVFFMEKSYHPIMRDQGKFISQIFSSVNYIVLIH